MQRKIFRQLIAWKDNPKRVPLIVNGARQVWKTYILKEFGAQFFKQVVHFNLIPLYAVFCIK